MPKRIAFTGGGTGGHIFPGLAVAEALLSRGEYELFWIGSGSPVEREIVRRWGIPFHAVPSGKLRRYFSLRNFSDVFRILAGFAVSLKILRREHPDLLFSKGGFVSVPPVIAASLLGIPVFSHESDVDPGLATRINLRFSERLFVAYERTRQCFAPAVREKIAVSGNPVRAEISRGDRARGRAFLGVADDRPLLLVLGGSQGSVQVNDLVAGILPRLLDRCVVVHQMGELSCRASSDERYITAPFFREEFADILAAADLVVARSGAGSVWELAARGKPSILIPLAGNATRGDQVLNARLFSELGAARVLEGEDASCEKLLSSVLELLDDPADLASMSTAAASLGSLNAAGTIAAIIEERTGAAHESPAR